MWRLWPVILCVALALGPVGAVGGTGWSVELQEARQVQQVITSVQRMFHSANVSVRFVSDRTLKARQVLAHPAVDGWDIGGPVLPSDVQLVVQFEQRLPRPRRVFAFCSACWYISLVLSQVFGNAPLDVVDLETSGLHAPRGAQAARALALKFHRDISFFKGSGAAAIRTATAGHQYSFAFLGGFHSHADCFAAFSALLPAVKTSKCIVVMQDFHLQMLQTCLARAACSSTGQPYVAFRNGHSAFGLGFLAFGFPPDAFSTIAQPSPRVCHVMALPH
eukprot:GGOE01053975.1.p1 GENE.GGOE01053975.1~~GGOE01053975.1.p1  ORF type:complete len:277 (+),score=54.51 GGOE01053975.1:827-1657(+)